ncbi:hypothetical protein [Thermoactinomyces mirandus]|uniref:Uncharacterized protein n=1 Tax=Thermoactinomyces mirandus TaxID=2756294 RepID=A0A7W1XPI9_9BACL|nr:hypothetical protein [Thermoactinomyces mirandus]MBA4600782.1 hypothetical protein [Thermoactinomyces mirandus]
MADEKIMEWSQRNLDNDLSQLEKSMLEKHLQESTEDRQNADELMEVSRQLSLLPRTDPPHSVIPQVLDQIEREETSRSKTVSSPSRTRWLSVGRAVAAAVIVSFAGLFALMKFQSSDLENGQKMGDTNEAGVYSQLEEKDANMEKANSVIWSPNQTYRAEWKERKLVVVRADGALQYERLFNSEQLQLQKIEWLTDQVVKVTLIHADRQVPEIITVDVVKKQEVQ